MMYSVLQVLTGSTTTGQSLHGLTAILNIKVHLEVPLSVSILLPALVAREITTIKKC